MVGQGGSRRGRPRHRCRNGQGQLMGEAASQLSNAIRDYLTLTGWMVCKNMSGVSRDRVGNHFQLGEKGRADMEAWKPRREGGVHLLMIEVKTTDALRPSQKLWLERAAKHGAICVIAKSSFDVEQIAGGLE